MYASLDYTKIVLLRVCCSVSVKSDSSERVAVFLCILGLYLCEGQCVAKCVARSVLQCFCVRVSGLCLREWQCVTKFIAWSVLQCYMKVYSSECVAVFLCLCLGLDLCEGQCVAKFVARSVCKSASKPPLNYGGSANDSSK